MILEEIANYLVASLTTTGTVNIGTKGNGVYVGYMPPVQTRVDAIALYESGGEPTIESKTIPDFRFQVLIRDDDIGSGRDSVSRWVYNVLHNKNSFLSKSKVVHCRGLNFPPIMFRNPDNQKWEFSMNFVMTVVETFSI